MASTKSMASRVMGIVIVAAVAAILLGGVFPVGIDIMVTDDSQQLTQNEGTTYEVDQFETNATSVSSTDATIELTYDGTTTSNTISEGSSQVYNLEGGDVNVTVNSVDTSTSPNSTTVTYEYATDFGWPGAVGTIFSSLVYFLILLPLAALAAIVVDLFDL